VLCLQHATGTLQPKVVPSDEYHTPLVDASTLVQQLPPTPEVVSQFSNAMLESEKTSTKFLKTFEYDFHRFFFNRF
jgi:hypothetical protein